MKRTWKKTALWGALAVSTAVGALVMAGANSPEVEPVYFALPLQPATGNPVDCVGNNDPLRATLSLGYPIGVRLAGKGVGTWDIYLPVSGTGAGQAVTAGAASPGGGYAFAGQITVTDVPGDSNAVNFTSTIATNAVVVKAGSGGSAQASSVYAYVRPPEANAQAGNDLLDFGWVDPPSAFPGAQTADQKLDSPSHLTQGISHLDLCFDPQPTVTKDVTLSWKRWQDWTISKTVNGKEVETLALDVGENVNVAYAVVANPTNLRRTFRAVGSITINDPLRRGYALADVTDTINIDGNQFVATIGNQGAFESFACSASAVGSTIYTCSYAIELASGAYPNIAAGDSVVNQVDVSLTHASGNKNLSYTTIGVVFAATPNASYGDTLVVDDDMLAGTPNHTFPTDGAWSYPIGFACPDPNDGQRVNTVTGTFSTGEGSSSSVDDSATVNYTCRTLPTVEKSAAGTSQLRYGWTMDKSVTPETVSMFDGDEHALDYTVTATRTLASNTVIVSGTILIKDAEEAAFTINSVADTVSFGGTDYAATVGTCVADATAGNGIIHSCPYSVTIDGSAHLGITSGSNKVVASVTRTSNSRVYAGLEYTRAFDVTVLPDLGASLSVADPMGGEASPHVFTDSGAWNYGHVAKCDPANQSNHDFTIDNTATGTFGPVPTILTSSESVAVHCRTVAVQKDAASAYDRAYAWAADKRLVVDPADINDANDDTCLPTPISGGTYAGFRLCSEYEITLNQGGRYDTVYQVAADRSILSESGFRVTGQIAASWPDDVADPVFAPAFPTDALYLDGGTQVAGSPVCGGLDGIANVLACTYGADLASKTNGYNVASFTRPRLCYSAAGVASACGTSSTYTSNQAPFAFGEPSQVSNACALLNDVFNAGGFNLGPAYGMDINGGAQVCDDYTAFLTGDFLFNGLPASFDIFADWLPPAAVEDGSCLFVVPNLLNVLFGEQTASSSADAGVFVPAICRDDGCTYTQGYWKTHAICAAKPQFAKKRDGNWDMIDGAAALNEGAAFYGSGMSYIQVMWTPPKGGNNYYKLAHQYIAAKLNVLSGASDADVAAVIAEVEALYLAHPSPGDSWWTKKGSARAHELAGILASFNEGAIGPGHCSVSPATILAAK